MYLNENTGFINHDAFKHPIELLIVDPMAPFDLPVEPRPMRFDIDVLDAFIQNMPMELVPELRAVVRLDHFRMERQSRENIIDELNRGFLIASLIDLQHPNARAVIDGRILIMPPSCSRNPRQELHIELDPMTGFMLLISLPSLRMPLISLILR
jgi:hypothetical protein